MLCLRREVERLSDLQNQCSEKDDFISQLRHEVTNLQVFIRHIEVDRCPICRQNAISSVSQSAGAGTTSTIPQPTSTRVSNLYGSLELVIGCQCQSKCV